MIEAVMAVQGGASLSDTDFELGRRGFLSKIGRWIENPVNANIKAVEECAQRYRTLSLRCNNPYLCVTSVNKLDTQRRYLFLGRAQLLKEVVAN